MNKRAVKKSKEKSISLNGLYGNFYIGEGDFVVHYFSTFASPQVGTGGHADLLEQLAPMRERVAASTMTSLDSLLQRDLSDERIAVDLIPYLEGAFSKIGFFPPVLAVLLPSGFIKNKNVEYPEPEIVNALNIKYGDYWEMDFIPEEQDEDEQEGSEEIRSRLGALKIYSQKTDVIVLDGQHRSNAFRYVAGHFEVSDAYKPFYMGANTFENYNSDLPVTIIWFESKCEEKVRPTDISRELFVAVNNSAKRVSESRTVLLDETNVTSLSVNTYYNSLAENTKFTDKGISLLTASFDTSSETVKPSMSVTDPSKLNSALAYSYFGNSRYDKLLDSSDRRKQNNIERFSSIYTDFDKVEKPEAGIFRIINNDDKRIFRGKFLEGYKNVLDLLFSEKLFLKSHYGAIAELEKWLEDESTAPEYKTLWENVYCGGEGLYHAYMTSSLSSCTTNRKYINGIDKKFRELRYAIAEKNSIRLEKKSLDKAYGTFDTIAFQTGFLMAFDYIYRNYEYVDTGDIRGAVKDFESALKKISQNSWATFFYEFKNSVIGTSMDPNSWPLFQKMILRLVDKDYEEIFSSNDEYPDLVVIRKYLQEKVESYYQLNDSLPEDSEVDEYKKDATKHLQSLISRMKLDNQSPRVIHTYCDSSYKSISKQYE